MSEPKHSETLEKLFENLGIKNGDPLLKEELEIEKITGSSIGSGKSYPSIAGGDKDEEDWCDSLNSDDIDVFKDYGTTPPRTERNRKQKERNAYCSHAVAAAKTFCSRNKHRMASRCASLPLSNSLEVGGEGTNGKLAAHNSLRQRKRSQDLQRTYDRQNKMLLDEQSKKSGFVENDDDEMSKCESLPPMMAVKVRSRYMSVSSRRIGRDWLSRRKVSTAGLPADRVSFYAHMVGLLKNSSQEHTIHLQSQRSEEEVLYQQEINEMLWLELQAWHAGQDTLAYDNYLLEQRAKVKVVYDEVMKFTFKPSNKDDPKIVQRGTSPSQGWSEPGVPCTGCLSVWCEKCRDRESEALDQVWHLLERVEEVEALFPSSRKLALCYPPWAEDDAFVIRRKALCLWFNATSQLRFIIDILGRRLGHMTKGSIPWPVFSDWKADARSPTQSVRSKDSGSHSMEESSDLVQDGGGVHRAGPGPSKGAQGQEPAEEKRRVDQMVRFEVDELDESLEFSDPAHSFDSSDAASSSHSHSNDHLFPPSVAQVLRRCSSDMFLEANPYRTYVEKLLRNKGMRKTLDKVEEVIRDTMKRVICIVEESHNHCGGDKLDKMLPTPCVHTESEGTNGSASPLAAFREDLRHTPCAHWMHEFASIGLPLFHTLFLFLASIPLHMMLECLKLRLEQMPEKPSRMSIRQLMTEYKEGIRFSLGVRQKYLRWCGFFLADLPAPLNSNLESRKSQAIEELDANVKKMLEVYLEWLDQFILMLHRETHVAGLQRNFLQDEWRFVQSTCPHVTDGQSLAATRFCNIACHMLCSVRDFLDTGLDAMISDLQASALDGSDVEGEDNAFEDEVEDLEDEEEGEPNILRKKLVLRCRSLQELIGEARERALRAIGLAKMLKIELEVALEAEAKELPDTQQLLDALLKAKHVLVKGHSLRNLLIFVPENQEKCCEEILSILQMQSGTSSDKYLLFLNSPAAATVEMWRGESVELSMNADLSIALSRVQVSGLMVIAKDGSRLPAVMRTLNDALCGVVEFPCNQISPHKSVTQTLKDMKTEALQLCSGLEKSISDMEDLVSITQFFPHADEECKQLSHLIRDTLHQGFLFGFEYHKEVLRLVSGRQRCDLFPMLIAYGRKWMRFVRSHYSSGKGQRPRWASPGFEFLLFVCDPHITSELSDADFKALRTEVEDCREYIIGSSSNSDASTPSTPLMMSARPFRSQSSSVSHGSSHSDSPSANVTDSPKFRPQLHRYSTASFDKPDEPESRRENPMECVRDSIEAMELSIEEQRFRDKIIGRVSAHNRELIEIKPHTVSFSWHRGFKIGAGHFGKVYTAVNNNSGELMAMKVLPLQPNDHRSIKRVANELKTFERIVHPHLVRYYGIEIHNDEMLMFMEYCDEGTLEALAARTEGLPEEIVRKYTRQLLSAVQIMHENGIVHRDIKGANIFLAQEGNILKLGDFGCAVRLRGLQTEVNELSGIVGTHAYMAPEIFRSNEGHGRAADIWSVGCVVIEMVTGKRPWPQYDSSVQIMFQVGYGNSPQTPNSVSEEGSDFLSLCFIHSPKDRATASKLLDHTFVKVEDDENMSLPLFSFNQSMHSKKTRYSSGDLKPFGSLK